MTRSTTGSREPVELVDELQGVAETLGVREVGPEEARSAAQCVDEELHVVLVERVDPHVATKRVARVLVEPVGHLLVHAVEAVEQSRHPGTAVLDHADAELREALEQPVATKAASVSKMWRLSS